MKFPAVTSALTLVLSQMASQCYAQKPTLTTIFSFPDAAEDGRLPFGSLILTASGTVYGNAIAQGSSGGGTVFALKPPAASGGAWTQNVLYPFPSPGGEGGGPNGLMTFGSGNVLYVAAGDTGESGAIYSVTPPSSQGGPWSGQLLYQFTGGQQGSNDGEGPTGVLVGAGGALYGTTVDGGTAQLGTVFQLTPPAQIGGVWTESLIWQFQGGADGTHPQAPLTPGPNGTFYGTTLTGGASDFGIVYQLTPPAQQGGAWTKATLYSFQGRDDGQNPAAPVIVSSSGALYGTTEDGGGRGSGTVYQLTPPTEPGGAWTEAVIYAFRRAGGDGAVPNGAICIGKNGALFGVTQEGGTSGKGTAFELRPPAQAGSPWTETILHSFSGPEDGAYPFFGMTLGPGGALFGTTQTGGPNGNGTIFQLVP